MSLCPYRPSSTPLAHNRYAFVILSSALTMINVRAKEEYETQYICIMNMDCVNTEALCHARLQYTSLAMALKVHVCLFAYRVLHVCQHLQHFLRAVTRYL